MRQVGVRCLCMSAQSNLPVVVPRESLDDPCAAWIGWNGPCLAGVSLGGGSGKDRADLPMRTGEVAFGPGGFASIPQEGKQSQAKPSKQGSQVLPREADQEGDAAYFPAFCFRRAKPCPLIKQGDYGVEVRRARFHIFPRPGPHTHRSCIVGPDCMSRESACGSNRLEPEGRKEGSDRVFV